MLFKMAFRNLLRNKRRTLLTSLMMIGGYTFISMSLALVNGSFGQIISAFTEQYTGHVQVANNDFVENPSLQKTIAHYNDRINEIEKNDLVRIVAPRIYSEALLYSKNKTFGAEIVGIDPKREMDATHYDKRIFEGIPFDKDDTNYKAIIGKKIAKILSAKIGEDIVLISQGADGSIANDIFKIVGIIGTEQEGKDDYRVYLPLKTAAEFYTLYGRVHELSIHLKDFNKARNFAQNLHFTDKNLIARPWQIVESDFYRAMNADQRANNISIFILILMVGVGILNTILMSTLERTREFGVLKALGTLPKQLFSLILMEGIFLSLICTAVGLIFSLSLNYYLTKNGIVFSEPIPFEGTTISELRAQISLDSYLYPTLLIILTTLLATLYPGIKSSKIGVSEALREI